MQPTRELYGFLAGAYDHFNRVLFEGALAPCMLTVQRQKDCMGLFYPERWVTENGIRCHELALNPTYFGAYRVIELFQTLVHEQCHMWQQEFGRPSRYGYHNRQWAAKMESLGLMPSSTGAPGGKRTGQHMSDYPLPDGAFLHTARTLITQGGRLRWLDRFRVADRPRADAVLDNLSPDPGDDPLLAPLTSLLGDEDKSLIEATAPAANRNKAKYSCPKCGSNVWGKPGLRIRCDDCNRRYRPAAGES